MKKNILTYINKLEGYKTAIKNLHWSSSNMSEHKLFDDIADEVASYQDEVSEMAQGKHGQVKKNELKPIAYKITTSKAFLEDLHKTAEEFRNSLNEKEYVGIRSVVEAFIGKVEQFMYLLPLALKEDFKRDYKTKLNESRIDAIITNTIRKYLH